MSNTRSLRSRLADELTTDLTVSVVSVVLAVTALLASAQVPQLRANGLYLAITVAVFVPYVYDQVWPVTYGGAAAAVWTVSAALVTAGLFVGLLQLARIAAPDEYAGAVAFLATVAIEYALAAAFMRARQHE